MLQESDPNDIPLSQPRPDESAAAASVSSKKSSPESSVPPSLPSAWSATASFVPESASEQLAVDLEAKQVLLDAANKRAKEFKEKNLALAAELAAVKKRMKKRSNPDPPTAASNGGDSPSPPKKSRPSPDHELVNLVDSGSASATDDGVKTPEEESPAPPPKKIPNTRRVQRPRFDCMRV